jgi:hypothetical protein
MATPLDSDTECGDKSSFAALVHLGTSEGQTALCVMPSLNPTCLDDPAACAQDIPPVQLAPVSLAGIADERLWSLHGPACSAAVQVAAGYAPTEIGNFLPSIEYAQVLLQYYPLLVGE